jgi:hypothetical protein
MKFDLIIGNPPYQKNTKYSDKITGCRTHIWDKFVILGFNLTKDNGYLSFIHPSGWRSPDGKFKKLGDIIKSKKIIHMQIGDLKLGFKYFKCSVSSDWYVIKNKDYNGESLILDCDGYQYKLNLRDFPYIANRDIYEMNQLMAKNEDEKIKMVFSRSAYDTRKEWVGDIKDDKYKYPLIYSLPKKGIRYKYSSRNDRGLFEPKVIMGGGGFSQVLLDFNGDYGLCPFTFGISDSKENLPLIKKALESEKFISLMKENKFFINLYEYNIIKHFKKDFWREFL